MKTCTKCQETKPADGFSPTKDKRLKVQALQSWCKACMVAKAKTYQQANKDRLYAQQAAWREANKAQWNQRMSVATAKRRAVKLNATVTWADNDLIADLYEYASIMRAHGVPAEVDHIVPLQGELVCGLHTPDNLTVVLLEHNRVKRNHFAI